MTSSTKKILNSIRVERFDNHLIVEVLHVDPLNPLPLILLLLLLQHELDEQLLQFLVAVVDAELLKAVVVKHLENIDVTCALQKPNRFSSYKRELT